jgi:hypothetical protein
MITAPAIHRLLTDSAHYFGLLPTPAKTITLLRSMPRQAVPANDTRHALASLNNEDQSCCA